MASELRAKVTLPVVWTEIWSPLLARTESEGSAMTEAGRVIIAAPDRSSESSFISILIFLGFQELGIGSERGPSPWGRRRWRRGRRPRLQDLAQPVLAVRRDRAVG